MLLRYIQLSTIHYFFLICLLFFTSFENVYAQKSKALIKGTITDVNEALPGVAVGIDSLNIGTISDADGNFQLINVPYGSHTISITYIGYLKTNINVMVYGDTIANSG